MIFALDGVLEGRTFEPVFLNMRRSYKAKRRIFLLTKFLIYYQ
ncbi:hypothetical protein IHE45_03G057600 [Dioscorea alata]|uniref:Uncharacterized protein n=1 Tax=Dioscorea alata TaxID=55571 RepID=A0ACB7WKN7_DIOAL|nr:hypothetical protein IHE45_03G057600 [Dioscorea alata]